MIVGVLPGALISFFAGIGISVKMPGLGVVIAGVLLAIRFGVEVGGI